MSSSAEATLNTPEVQQASAGAESKAQGYLTSDLLTRVVREWEQCCGRLKRIVDELNEQDRRARVGVKTRPPSDDRTKVFAPELPRRPLPVHYWISRESGKRTKPNQRLQYSLRFMRPGMSPSLRSLNTMFESTLPRRSKSFEKNQCGPMHLRQISKRMYSTSVKNSLPLFSMRNMGLGKAKGTSEST